MVFTMKSSNSKIKIVRSSVFLFTRLKIVGLKQDVISFIFYIITSMCFSISLRVITLIDNV